MAKLHYDKEKLLEEYTKSYDFFIKSLVWGIGSVLVFFVVFIIYLGGYSHTKHKPKYDQFKDRFTIEYEGELKLPYYEE